MNTRVYDHVVFDLDGTLADTRDDLVEAVNHVLRTLRLPVLPAETICQYIGEGARLLVERALGSAHQNRVEEALALFLPYYAAHLLDRTTAYPGVAEVVSTLHERGVTLSLLSNKPQQMSRTILDGLGLLPAFAIVLGADSVPIRKPDPSGIECLLDQTGTPRERLLLIGDSKIDLETARAAQIAFCGVAWGIRPGELLRTPGVHRVIHRAEELLAVVDGDR